MESQQSARNVVDSGEWTRTDANRTTSKQATGKSRPEVQERTATPGEGSEGSRTRSGGKLAPTMPVKMLKALAHPVRQQIGRALNRRGHARAADLAADLAMPANQISFHLRVLADAGMIREAPEYARDRRDRVWVPVHGSWNIGSPESPVADEALGGALFQWVSGEVEDVLRRVLAYGADYSAGRTAEVHGTLMNISIRLTTEEFEEAMNRISEVLDEYRESPDRPANPDARHWDIEILAADDEI